MNHCNGEEIPLGDFRSESAASAPSLRRARPGRCQCPGGAATDSEPRRIRASGSEDGSVTQLRIRGLSSQLEQFPAGLQRSRAAAAAVTPLAVLEGNVRVRSLNAAAAASRAQAQAVTVCGFQLDFKLLPSCKLEASGCRSESAVAAARRSAGEQIRRLLV